MLNGENECHCIFHNFIKEAGQKMYDAVKILIEITKKEAPERVHIGPNNEEIAESDSGGHMAENRTYFKDRSGLPVIS